MKKQFKAVLIILSSVLVLFLGSALVYYLPMIFMPRVKSGPIQGTDIFTLKDMVGVYLIKTNNGYIMIDAGLNRKNIENSLNEANIDKNEVKAIFLTHSDGDHVAGLGLFPNSSIYISNEELPLINGTVKRSFLGYNKLPDGIDFGRIISLMNGQELLIDGKTIKCIFAPGHTIGSMIYLVDNHFLFTGDAIKLKNGNIDIHPYTMDKELSKRTIKELGDIINNCTIVVTAHYGVHYNN